MRVMKTAVLALCVLLLSGSLAFGADTVKIGLLVPLTGPAAADGTSALYSVQIALDQVNAAGGVLGKKVELIYYDDRADAKEAVALSHKLIEQDGIDAFVAGSYSLPTRAVAPIFQEEGIPLVAAYAIHPDVTRAGDYCFRNGFLGMVEGRAAGYTAHKLLGGKTVALLTSDNDFGRTLVVGFKEYAAKYAPDLKIVSEQAYPFSEKDYKPYLSKIKELDPDVIFASGYYFQTGPLLRQARELGIQSKILGEEGADSPKLMEIAGDASEGFHIVTNFDRDDPRPVVQDFLKEFRSRHKFEPDMVGASAYDAFMIITDGMKTSGSTEGAKVRDAIAAVKDYNGLTGIIGGFDEIGEVVKPVQVQVVKEGLFRHFGVVNDPELIKP
ncbi:ABC transporter substrate-binding protein [Aminivibrio sp.]|jgi:branched-chain amino acid transport system substrate-binding protein|uniref:ABC transporter substrate-binding protein n=1 Tax=Aminivibrio sp. TaxID=1872489 RepID=UPI00169CD021|nr:ABC transporter substrate-binding protein [Synergistaceae bacterium]NCC56128.1 ABC transporter substrate-binding protein [Synergistales bacterium]NLO57526.1 ABC transporter substrate-binding protein [Synergistaceae bacterium]